MMSLVVNKKMEVNGRNVSAFRNMAVWEGGYNVCLDICRSIDKSEHKNDPIMQQLKSGATQIPINLARAASFKIGKQYMRHLRGAFVSAKQLETLILLAHDLNYLPTERFLDLNSKLNQYGSKLWKYIKYTDRKIRSRLGKN